MTAGLSPAFFTIALVLSCATLLTTAQTNEYALDRQSTCGKTLTVYGSEITLLARSNVAPANPPLECIVYLQSAYQAADGRSRLQIIVEELSIEDCNVRLALFNGNSASGQYLRLLGCSSSSTDIIYSRSRTATLRFTRPLHLYQTTYDITLTVKAYADGDEIGTEVGVATLSVGAIIGIVIGLLVVIAVAILLGWCCCTGYIHNFLGRGREKGTAPVTTTRTAAPFTGGSIDSNLEKLSTVSSNLQFKNGIPSEEPSVSVYTRGSQLEGGRQFSQGVPRKAVARGYINPQADSGQFVRSGREGRSAGNAEDSSRESHLYEPYDADGYRNYSPRFRKRGEDRGASGRSGDSRRPRSGAAQQGEEGRQGGGKETMIDDVGSSSSEDNEKKDIEETTDEEICKTDDSAPLHREGSEVAVETIASPMHVNAAVRASVPDLSEPPPSATSHPHEGVRGKDASPGSRRRPGGGRDPDPMGLPPEAFDPVFTTPTSQEQYPGEWRPMHQPLAMPFMPYGMVPLVPGQQTYAYAYQTAPQVGAYPGQQGAYFMQSVPTAEGDVHKTTFAMHSERTPRGQEKRAEGRQGHPGAPDFSSTPRSDPGEGKALIPSATVGSPDGAQRSVAVKSFADPRSDMQTTQVLWTDTVPDPSDPKPGDSSQVTRKTTTRVTTRSGHGDLPQQTSTLLDEPDPNPAFLAPSDNRPALLPPAALTPSASNVHYYTGQRSAPVAPADVIHEAPSRNRAIKDSITFGDSSDV